MKRNLFILIIAILLSCSLIGCEKQTTVVVNVEDKETIHNSVFGIDALIEIGNKLWYDSTTRIVYFWNGCLRSVDCSTTPSPYYAPNGKPYKYNPETNTFYEIENEVN